MCLISSLLGSAAAGPNPLTSAFQFAGATTTSSDPVLGKHNISEEEKRRLKKSKVEKWISEKVFINV